jgi:hypothetical protein
MQISDWRTTGSDPSANPEEADFSELGVWEGLLKIDAANSY